MSAWGQGRLPDAEGCMGVIQAKVVEGEEDFPGKGSKEKQSSAGEEKVWNTEKSVASVSVAEAWSR